MLMENEPLERSLLSCIHFRVRMKWVRENNEHLYEIIEQQTEMPRFVDLYRALNEVVDNNHEKSDSKML